MESKKIATKLKELRANRGMSQEYLAEEARVSLRTIQRIENNESQPTGETIKRIAMALGVELQTLLDGSFSKETDDLSATIIFLKKQLSKTNDNSDIKIFKKFIGLLQRLKEKELTIEQLECIESYIQYLELEKIPTYSNEIFKQQYTKLKLYLKNKLHFIPNNHYITWTLYFCVPFTLGFVVQNNINTLLKFGVLLVALLFIGIALALDQKAKKKHRSFRF